MNSVPKIHLVRAVGFSAAHRYFDRGLSSDENRALYGSLYRENGFGHNFLFEAHFRGPVDPLTGMIVNLKVVDAWLKEVMQIVDHKRLNDLPEFATPAPTPERLCVFLFRAVRAAMLRTPGPDEVELVKTRLYEGDALWVDFAGDADGN